MSVGNATAQQRLNLGFGRRAPMILQTEASECGLASLAMVAAYFGYETDLADLRRRYGFSLRGATLKDLVRIADQLGFATRPLRLDVDEVPKLRLPCILHWDLNHFVVIVSVGRSGVVIHDPAVGVRRMRETELSRHFTGVALELYPTDRFEPAAAPPRIGLWRLLGRMVGVKRALSHQAALAFAIEIFAIISPVFMSWVIDNALVTADRDLLLTLMLGFTLLLLLQTAITAMRSWMLMGLSATLKVQARANLFSHLISLPASFFEARHLGDVTSRFSSQEAILSSLTTELVEVIMDGMMTAFTLTIMLVIAPGMAGIVVATAVLYAALRWASYTPLRQASVESIVWQARLDSHFLETLRGIRTIKLFNGQEGRRAYWLNLLVEATNRRLTADKLRLLFRTGNMLLLGTLKILILWIGASHVMDNTLSVGLMLAFIAYKDQFIGRVSVLIDRAVDLKMLRLHAERLSDIALTEPETRSSLVPTRSEHPPATIELRNVSFRYGEQDPWVLDNVSLRVEAGESVAIVGPSGGGKTTLLKLLTGLVKPNHGEIFIGGEPLARIGIENYRAMIGVVMQDDQLFAGSIADDICFFSERPDLERIMECAKMAAVHDDIVAMPMAYGTLIGDMGTVLSGGQKQRVVIARALYSRPAILLLDEATSHLDVEREHLVNAAFQDLRITRVVIAHRPETIRMSQRVVALEQGRIKTGVAERYGARDLDTDGRRTGAIGSTRQIDLEVAQTSDNPEKHDASSGRRAEDNSSSNSGVSEPPAGLRDEPGSAIPVNRAVPLEDHSDDSASTEPRLPPATFDMPARRGDADAGGEPDDAPSPRTGVKHELRDGPSDDTRPVGAAMVGPDGLRSWGRAVVSLPDAVRRDLALFMLLTGTNLSVAERIRVRHVDLARGILCVPRMLGGPVQSSYDIPLSPVLVDLLRTRVERAQGLRRGSSLLFPSESASKRSGAERPELGDEIGDTLRRVYSIFVLKAEMPLGDAQVLMNCWSWTAEGILGRHRPPIVHMRQRQELVSSGILAAVGLRHTRGEWPPAPDCAAMEAELSADA